MSLSTTAVRIKVTLKDVKPEVMRCLVVPLTLRLDRLHLTLQAAFGWTNSHLFE
ncbi:plasmid pRiA4b ORF-3 family protein, partial [Bradyrhizobium sp. 166]|nr:plasmid pRiA4b ORF-3 family protein [Bradyrhizobium sp. CW11]MCK1575117.1 plasmid pRiA4b ORF-3 family protein [Bradyrhizobium sp. 174]MCK1604578.1 plasmid pRiA4b ORF-3 family protein [Bradyrhizobium sp. 166]MCK1703706.1 plasmid pRiA4b ORF-3 family protein [Bradyrhizobium sp. 146]